MHKTNDPSLPTEKDAAKAKLLARLTAKHREVLTGQALYTTLQFSSSEAFRKARRCGQVHVTLFSMPNRRGQFALTAEVVDWLYPQRFESGISKEEELPYE